MVFFKRNINQYLKERHVSESYIYNLFLNYIRIYILFIFCIDGMSDYVLDNNNDDDNGNNNTYNDFFLVLKC